MAAEQVAKILGGAPPNALPLRQATRYDWSSTIGLKALGQEFPSSLLSRYRCRTPDHISRQIHNRDYAPSPNLRQDASKPSRDLTRAMGWRRGIFGRPAWIQIAIG
jgi:hypothetical protein